MRKLLVALGGLFICLSAQAQSGTGTITTSNADCTVAAACANAKLSISDPGSVTIQVTGTWTATLQLEASSDGGTTFVALSCTPLGSSTAVTSATANGTWRCNAASITDVRVRASAMASGTALISFRSSKAVANAIGGGGAVFASGGTTNNVIPKSNGSSLLADSPLLAPDANTVRQANTTTGQTLEVYGTTDSNSTPVNYERLSLQWNAGQSNFRITTEKGGSGTLRTFDIGAGGGFGILSTGGSRVFQVGNTGLISTYGNGTTAGQGVVPIMGVTSQKSETTSADANVLTVTPPGAVATYRVSVAISVSSATSGIISWTLSWTDSNGTAQSNIAQPLFQLGTAAPNTTFTTSVAGNYQGSTVIDVNNAAAAIVVKWVGGGTTAAKMSAFVERVQ